MGWFMLMAGAALTWSPAWRVMSFWGVYLHEMGHAVTAVLTGGNVRAIRLNPDGSGHTEWIGEIRSGISGAVSHFFARTVVLLAGYTHAAIIALLAVTAAHYGGLVTQVMLWVSAGVCVLSLIGTRGWRAILAALATIGVCAAAAWWSFAPTLVLELGAASAVMGGLRSAISLHRARLERGDGSDPGQLAAVTSVPTKFWTAFFLLWNVAAVLSCALVLVDWAPLP